jgi:hypothetical protein
LIKPEGQRERCCKVGNGTSGFNASKVSGSDL